MSDPRFRPNRYTTEPQVFGKAETIGWITPKSPSEEDRVRAAKLQHEYAVLIYKAARRKYGSLRGYADAAELGYDRLAKVMRGDALLRLEDIATAERLLGKLV